MADAVNRIVPPSVSLERAGGLGRERERKHSEEKHHAETPVAAAPEAKAEERGDLTEPEQDKIKGKNLDINA